MKIDWKDRRIAPHWSLLVAALIIFAFLIDTVRPYINPLSMSVAILILLYPSRRIRAIKPLLFLAFIVAIISIWWRLSALLTPFFIAFILAYAFNPLVEWLAGRNFPRLVVILGLIIVLLALLVGGAILVLPRLWEEINNLANVVPNWIEEVKKWGENYLFPWLKAFNIPVKTIWGEVQPRLPNILNSIFSTFADWSGKALSGIIGFIAGLFNLILIPILMIYFLNDFPKIRRWVYSLFPDDYKADAYKAYNELNTVLSAYIRGQLIVCLFLATWIGIGLLIFAKLPYALILGAAAGILNLLPYVGTTSALILTLVVAMFQPAPVATALKSLVVFVTAQSIEGNFITPRIVGDRVGLHPVVVIFVVLLFATLFGFVGMLIAIPVGASTNVLYKVWAERMKRLKAR